MSRKERIKRFVMADNLNMATATTLSEIASLGFVDDIGVQINFTTGSGTFQLQTSIDYDPVTSNAGIWAPVLLTYWNGSAFVTAYDIPTSVGSPIFLDLSITAMPVLRILYTAGSGSGLWSAFLTAKGL